MVTDMLRRFVASALLTGPIVLFSPIGQSVGFDVQPPFGVSMAWFGLILATPVVFWGGWPFLGGADDVFFEAAAMLTTFSLAGHWLEMRSRFATGRAVQALLELAPPTAQVRRDGEEIEIPLDEVVVGDEVVVRPGSGCQWTALSKAERVMSTSR